MAHSTSAAAPGGERRVEGLGRDEACRRYHRKVLLIARSIHARLAPDATIQLDDLVSCGAIGLIEAFDRFDARRGIAFSTYAEYRIRGAIYDALRGQDTFSRRRRELARRVERATEHLRQALGRDPEASEVAVYLEIDLEEYWAAIDRVKPVTHASLHAGEDDEQRPLSETIEQQDAVDPGTVVRVRELREQLAAAIDSLPEKQRDCIVMYYGTGMSLAEIASVYGVTVSRISQIISAARKVLRKRLDGIIDEDDLLLDFG